MATLETSPPALAAHEHYAHERAPAALTWLALAAVGAATALFAQIGGDARWLPALGSQIGLTGAVPNGLPFAAAGSDGWQNVPVLAELVLHWLYAAFADRGLVLAQVAAVSVGFAALARDLRAAKTGDGASALVLVATAVAATPALLVVRAQLFSLALFPLLALLLRSEARTPSRRIWLVVPLVAVWSNLHGGVLVGVTVAACYLLLGRGRRDPVVAAGVLCASFAALFATPALLGTASYYHDVLTGEVASRALQMWAPLSLHAPLDVLFLVVAVPLCVAALRARPAVWELAALAALAAMAAHANRNTVWFALFVAVPAARAFHGAGRERRVQRLALAAAAPLGVAVVVGLAQTPIQTAAGAALVRRAAAAAEGRPILADPINGEQLALAGQRIWIGNPLDAFDRPQQRLYLDWLEGRPQGDRQLSAASCAVLVTIGSKPQRGLARNGGYRELARDARAVLYERRACPRG
jgi:hypothetical protein